MKAKTVFTMILAGLVVIGTAGVSLAGSPPDRNVYFGQTHQHTSWSFVDACIFGNTFTGPEEAYKDALGQTIKHPAGYDIKIKKPLVSAVRVAGSWLAAVGMLMLGWLVQGKG